ncbi:MAG: hypothetical protein IIY55_10725 [Blautia sp.]|nr:hypothetical protein [Blautia sp.]
MVSRNPVSQYGVKMHNTPAAAFFEQGARTVRATQDPALTAYLLGFGCHFILDSRSHPFVNRMQRENVVSHTLLEKEFDRYLMVKTGKNPYSYYPSDAIVPKQEYAQVIHKAIPKIRTSSLLASLHMMKLQTNLMVCDDGGRRRKAVEVLLKPAGRKGQAIVEYFMTSQAPQNLDEPLEEMERLFRAALKEAPACLSELWTLFREEGRLSERWDIDFNGNKKL